MYIHVRHAHAHTDKGCLMVQGCLDLGHRGIGGWLTTCRGFPTIGDPNMVP